MANKQETVNLVDIFKDFKENKSIDKRTLITVLEESFKTVILKMYGPSADYTIIVNPDKGDLEIYRNRLVMEDGDVANPDTQIALSDALLLDDEAEVGEEVTDKVELASFGRRMILNLRQTLASKILELQKEALYEHYKDMRGQIVTGALYQVWKKEILLLDEEVYDQPIEEAAKYVVTPPIRNEEHREALWEAMKAGTEAHARYEAVGWIDPSAPKDDFERRILECGWDEAFVKGGDAVALWRERSYELLVGVVFRGEGAARSACVYDFKTNAKRRDESDAEFERRMAEAYGGQMAAYRAAVSSLTGIPLERVRAVLLLAATGAKVAAGQP